MAITLSDEERIIYLTIMVGGGNKVIYDIYASGDEKTKERILSILGDYNRQLEPVMDAYGLGRDPEGVARGM
ncbi:MAG TPA: hypothetical protein ENN21_11020, partial [Spirochaetes bacterium]|nr:hypothetical protein [Spirochaetota bacterium]